MLVGNGDAFPSKAANSICVRIDFQIKSADLICAGSRLGNQNANVEVTVDTDKITSISLVPLSESIETMYPLMQPAMETLASQIIQLQSLEGLEYPSGSQYTSVALMNAVKTALSKAELPKS